MVSIAASYCHTLFCTCSSVRAKGKSLHRRQPIVERVEAEDATRQWFNKLNGELTQEEPHDFKGLGFGEDRPWRHKADSVLIIRNLKPQIE